MRKPATKLIAFTLCILLLGACAPAEDIPEPTSTPEVTAAPTPEPTPEPYAGGCTAEEIKYAGEHIQDYFELYTLLNPGADIHSGGYSTNPNKDGYIEVDCYGVDLPAFEASGILPACVKLMYSDFAAEIAASHPVPYIPEATTSFDNGLTITLDRVVYPIYPEYLGYTWSTTQQIMYGYGYTLEKYIDGEWAHVPGNYSFLALGLILSPGEPEHQYHSHGGNSKLGEGLYRLTISGDYPVEFVVSADAEPLEPYENVLAADASYAAYAGRMKLQQSNIFYKTRLPGNVKNELVKHVYWSKEAPTYSTEFDFSMSNDEIASLLLADMHSYNTADGSYTSDYQRLTFENNGLTLVNNTPTARAMKLVYPFSPTLLTPMEFQEQGIRKGSNISNGWKSIEFHFPELWTLFDGCESFSGWEMPEDLVAFSSLNWELGEALDHLRSNMSEDEFLAEYGDLVDHRFKNISGYGTRAYVYGHVNLKVNDAAQSIITDKSSPVFSGSEIYYTKSGSVYHDLVIKDTPTAIHDNGDTAPVIPPYDAAAALLPALEEISEDVSIISVEFAYAYHHGDLTTLRPTWIFTLTQRTPSPSNDKIVLDNYTFLAVDAHTGTLLNPTTTDDRRAEAVERAKQFLDVQENFDDYFYAYQKDHPDAAYWWYSRTQRDGTLQVHCGGPDIAAVDASAYLPDIIILDYDPHQPDARLDEDIPRDPITDYEFIDGVTVSMKQAAYPPATESVEVVFANDRDMEIPYDVDYTLYKYIDGEWQRIPRPNSLGTGHRVPVNTELTEVYHFPYPLGKGLYRITPGSMGRYDFENFSLDHTIEFIVSEQ